MWELYPSHHNGLFSPLFVWRDYAARRAYQSRSAPLQLPGSTSAGRVICECISVPEDFLWPQGTFPQAFIPFRGLDSSPGAWGAPNKGNANGAVGIFGNTGRVRATALRPKPPKKALCHTCPLGGASNIYCRSISVLSEQYDTSYLFYVTLSFLCNIICYLISVFDPFRCNKVQGVHKGVAFLS